MDPTAIFDSLVSLLCPHFSPQPLGAPSVLAVRTETPVRIGLGFRADALSNRYCIIPEPP